jgi:predicted RNA-binding Zn-ribbon protein involved in translation (DUF1610 family)
MARKIMKRLMDFYFICPKCGNKIKVKHKGVSDLLEGLGCSKCGHLENKGERKE